VNLDASTDVPEGPGKVAVSRVGHSVHRVSDGVPAGASAAGRVEVSMRPMPS
jgi:hypothetical protein